MLTTTGFQPCDIRGIYGDTPDAPVNPYLVFLAAKVIADAVPADGSVTLSGDGRSSTPVLLAAAKLGLGDKAIFLGDRVPTSMGYLAKQVFKAHACMIITASHNPAPYNGVKFQIGDLPVTPDVLNGMKQKVLELAAKYPPPVFEPCTSHRLPAFDRIWSDYEQHADQTFNPACNMPVVIDAMHGSFATLATDLLKKRGFQVTPMRNECLGDFSGLQPDPSVNHNLLPVIETVRNGQFAFGAALDGDGDRACFVDDTGTVVDNGSVLVLLAQYLKLKQHLPANSKIVYDQKIRLSVVATLTQLGFKPIMEQTGHAFVRRQILNEQAVLGGEESGHFFWNHTYPVPAGDCGLYAILAIADLIQITGKSLSQLRSTIPPSPFYTGDIRELRYNKRNELIRHLADNAPSDYLLSSSDGIRLELDDGLTPIAFGQIRPSATEPEMMTATFDALNEAAFNKLTGDFLNLLPPDAVHIKMTIENIINSSI